MPWAKPLQLTLLIIVAGCTTQTKRVANDEPDVQCHTVQSVSSLITKTVCTTRAQRVDEQEELRDLKRAVETQAGASPRPSNPASQ
jgi:hypothetical protein